MHELKGQSFKSMAAETGVNVTTLARNRYAVLHLRIKVEETSSTRQARNFAEPVATAVNHELPILAQGPCLRPPVRG